ncbi:hypothetical protein NHH03_15845 [Stieleria sp. TO1_6]|uniref:hypothetical protein n=1 Tax=Stieleria tagensis TaxID=2956795 RepID=UPI00209AAF77|nr:hypothetical protein [Stieleria tagensis]MCO8123221.1 hypothetical protein [Stieleria tagensis]
MSDTTVSTTTASVSSERRTARGATAAKYLVAFIFLINVCFAAYMVVQFFVPKTYGNGLHTIYTTVVFGTALFLGFAAHRLWTGHTKQGTYLFFAAVAVSFIGNLISSLFA